MKKSNPCRIKAIISTGSGDNVITGSVNMPERFNRITDFANDAPGNGLVIYDARGFGEDNTVLFLNWRYVVAIMPMDN